MFCPECGKANPDDFKFCPRCGTDLQDVRASLSVGGNVGPGAVVGSGKVEAQNIAGRDVINEIHHHYGTSTDLELEKLLRERLFVANEYKNRDDVERWVAFYRARGKRPDLGRAQLAGLQFGDIDLAGVYLSKADLSEANLRGADLSGAFLYGANLARAYIGSSATRLVGAKLEKADLTEADANNADLRGANLKGANLTLTALHGADLTGAIVEEGQLAQAASLKDAVMPDGSRHP